MPVERALFLLPVPSVKFSIVHFSSKLAPNQFRLSLNKTPVEASESFWISNMNLITVITNKIIIKAFISTAVVLWLI